MVGSYVRGATLPDRIDQRAIALQDAVALLSRADTREAIGSGAVRAVSELLGAAVATAFVVEGEVLRRIAWHGLSEEARRANLEIARDAPYPIATAVATGEAIWIESYDDLVRLYPHVRNSLTPVEKLQAIAALPLVADGRLIGAIAITFDAPGTFGVRDRRFLLTLADHTAVALERLRLRAEEEAARNRLTVLAEASRRFTEARLDLGAILETVAYEIAHRLRDSCAINLLSGDRTVLEPVALHHVDADANESIRRTMAAAPVRMDDDSNPARVAATGRAAFVPVVPLQALLATVRPEYRAHLERHPISSLVVVPLRVLGEVIGTMTVTRGPAGPTYTSQDYALVQDLADRAALAIANARLFDEARQAVALRDDFLAIAGHELNTPVAALQLQIQSVLRQADTLDPRLRERLGKIGGNVGRLGRLVATLLDVSRIAEGKLTVDKAAIDLTIVVREVVEGLRAEMDAAGCPIHLDLPAAMPGSGDRLRVEQLITNLLGNAVKYGAGQPVEVAGAVQDGRAWISVRDHGIGISPEDEARIFQQFERAVSPRHYSGFGLGLWIARQIAEGHGGTIRFERPAGRGARFVVDLPL